MKPRMLDLFSGAGGATRGYQLAGFHVTGVDNKPQPRYCGDAFVQTDALFRRFAEWAGKKEKLTLSLPKLWLTPCEVA